MLRTGPSFSVFLLFYLFGHVKKTQIVSMCAKIVFSNTCQDVKNEIFEKKLHCLPLLCCCKRNRKTNGKGQKTLLKMFLRWLSKNENEKMDALQKFVSGRKKNAHFRAHYLFWSKTFWSQIGETRNNYKIVVSAEIARNQK